MHALVAGDASLPTVVLDSGMGVNCLAFSSVFAPMSVSAHVVAFDRAGYPWSDPAPDEVVLDSAHAVEDARSLLAAMGRTPPYVLGGLSYGGINMLTWALRYPDEVAALALIESSAPEMATRVPRMNPVEQASAQLRRAGNLAAKGWLRRLPVGLRLRMIPGMEHLQEPYRSQWGAIAADPVLYAASLREADALSSSLLAARTEAGALGDVPLIVLTGARMWGTETGKGGSWLLRADQKRAMHVLREGLAALSMRGEHRIVEGAGHLMPLDQPDAVIAAMVELVAAAKGG